MVKKDYIPERGDIVWMDFPLPKGHEQGGRRPAVVISMTEYNERSGLMLACPITSKEKGYPFEVEVKARKINGVVLADQVRSADWRVRGAEFVATIGPKILKEIENKILALFGRDGP